MSKFSFKRLGITLFTTVAILYFAACVLLYLNQRSFIYHPVSSSRQSNLASLTVESDGEKLKILTRKANSTKALIYFGGNADDVSTYLTSFTEAFPEHNLFLANYRGYGGSSGEPSEAALFADAVAVYDKVRGDYSEISVIGRSLGSGVAVYLASVRDVDRLVLVTPYDSIKNVGKKHLPIFPIGLLLKDKFDSASRVKDVSARTLIILAETDRTIPRGNSEALISQFPKEQVRVETLPETTHNSVVMSKEYLPLVHSFLR